MIEKILDAGIDRPMMALTLAVTHARLDDTVFVVVWACLATSYFGAFIWKMND